MITYNNKTFFKDGKVWFPVMGEYQYSRSDSRFWDEGISKMKSLGIDVVASYSFWIHHEEIEGHFNFRGNNNLRKFLRIIKDHNLLFCLRIGPWVHGEARNGGFPDWIYNKGYNLRSNDKGYMESVEKYFKELYLQCKGYLYSEGGPIFSIQVENEYSQWGKQGETIGDNHINALISMLKRIGFNVPVYFATGWGQAATGNAVPVWGCYSEAPWENSNTELPPQEGFLITPNSNDSNIGSDTGKKEMDADTSKSKYPYATVEIGSGIQVTLTRRPIIKGEDAENLVLSKLGSGINALGYYVFHGGMNPIGALTTMQEYLIPGRNEGGFNCDLPIINYDFQGGISQYGKITELGKHLKLYNYFSKEFGEILSPMDVFFPKDNAMDPNDLKSMRYSVRYNNDTGFIFINNFIRHYDLPNRHEDNFKIEINNKPFIEFNLDLKNKESCIYPVNLKTPNGVIKFISATPLLILNGKDYVFWKNSCPLQLSIEGNIRDNIIVLNKQDAVNAYKFNKDNIDYLFISNGSMFEDDNGINIEYRDDLEVKVYPDYKMPSCFIRKRTEDKFTVYSLKCEKNNVDYSISLNKEDSNDEYTSFNVSLNGKVTENTWVKFFYLGNKMEIRIDGELIADDYYTGAPYEIFLRNYGVTKNINVRIYPLFKEQFVYIENMPNFINNKVCSLEKIELEENHKVII